MTSNHKRHSSIYDLYSVINHQGTLTSGHYVNISKNSLDNSWYQFDDDIIDKVGSDEVISESSYVLFYQRRNTKLSPDRHWCLRLPQVQKALDEARLRKLEGPDVKSEPNYVEEYTDEVDEDYDDDEAPLVSTSYQAETLRRKKTAATLIREAVEEAQTKYVAKVSRTNSTPGLPGEETNYLTMGRGKSTTALGTQSTSSAMNDDRLSLDMKAPSAPTTPRMTRDISTKTLPRNSKIMWQKPRSRPQSYAEPGEGGVLIATYAGSKSSSNIQDQGQDAHKSSNTQQRRQPSRYRHRTERGRREKRDGSRSHDQGRSRSRGRSGERRRYFFIKFLIEYSNLFIYTFNVLIR